jgi:O-antigen ligase
MTSFALQPVGASLVLEGASAACLSPGRRIFIVGLVAIPTLAVISAWNPSSLSTAIAQMTAFLLALICVAAQLMRQQSCNPSLLFASAVALPAVGCLQLVAMQPAYRFATSQAILYWAAVAAVILAGEWLLGSSEARSLMLSAVICLGFLATVLEVIQVYAYGRYQVTSTSYPLLSSNYYAELIEIILPIVLTRVFRDHRHYWVYVLIACLFVSTVIAAAARVGSALVLIESVAVIVRSYGGSPVARRRWRAACTVFVLATAALVSLQGPVTLVHRLREADPLAVRADLTRSAISMIHQRPLTGYGLGSFPIVYPAFARFDNGYFVNHAHNDYLEALVDGGPMFLVALVSFLVISGSAAIRVTWAVGLLVLPFHAAVDFPLQRSGVLMLYALVGSAATAKIRQSVVRYITVNSPLPLCR